MNEASVPSSDTPTGNGLSQAVIRNYVVSAVVLLMVASAVYVVWVDRNLGQPPDISQDLDASVPLEDKTAKSSMPVVVPSTPNPVVINMDFGSGPYEIPSTPTVIPARRDSEPQFFLVKVRPGDTLAALASRHKYSFSEIASLNGIDPPYLLRVGDELLFPNR